MSSYEKNLEELRAVVLQHRKTLEDLWTSHRDFGLLLGQSVDAEAYPSQWLARLMSESTAEAERLFKSGQDAMEALRRLGFWP